MTTCEIGVWGPALEFSFCSGPVCSWNWKYQMALPKKCLGGQAYDLPDQAYDIPGQAYDLPKRTVLQKETFSVDHKPGGSGLFGCCQRTTARKTPVTSDGVGSRRGVDQELANFWATLCTKSCLGDFVLFFSYQESKYKIRLARSWPRVEHGLPTFDTNISVLKLQGCCLQ